jgi:serine/threonine protein kinase
MELRRELLLLYFLKHPNLVEFHGGCYHREEHSFYIVTRLYQGSLRSFFSSLHERGETLTDAEKCKLAYDVALGIQHLHNIGSSFSMFGLLFLTFYGKVWLTETLNVIIF